MHARLHIFFIVSTARSFLDSFLVLVVAGRQVVPVYVFVVFASERRDSKHAVVALLYVKVLGCRRQFYAGVFFFTLLAAKSC